MGMLDRLPDEVLAAATEAERVEYSIHYQAVLETAKAYRREPSKSRLHDWEGAKKALAAAGSMLMEKYGNEQEIPQEFPSQKEVLAYLKGQGYKIEKSALSNHVRRGLLKLKKGVFRLADVDAYAQLHLHDAGTGQTGTDKKSAALQERKVRAEILRIEEQGLAAKIQRETLEGKLISRADVELELAGRAVVLDSGLRGLIQAKAAGWIEIVGGDQAMLPDLIEQMTNNFGDLLDQYARTSEFVVEMNAEV